MDVKSIAAYGKQVVEQQEKNISGFTSIAGRETKKVSEISDIMSLGDSRQKGDSGAYSPQGTNNAGADVVQAKQQEKESLSVLTGSDYEALEKEEGSVLDTDQESVERAAEKIKEQKALAAEWFQEGLQVQEELQEGLEQIQAQGFLSEKGEAQLRELLEEAGIPATENNITQIVSAWGMAQDALAMTQQSQAFLIDQELPPTIENLYQGKYLVSANQTQAAGNQEIADYEEQIAKILEKCGRADETAEQNAKWLFEQELPIDETTLSKLETLQQIQKEMTPQKVLEQILFAMSSGDNARNANMDTTLYDTAAEAVRDFQIISDRAVVQAAQQTEKVNLEVLRRAQSGVSERGEDDTKEILPLVFTDDMLESDIAQVTLKRQLEEIRQKMTVQAAIRMGQKGIHVDTEYLDKLVEELKEIENTYYSRQIGEDDRVLTEKELDLFQETLSKKADIANSHAALLGTGVRQKMLLTVNQLHAAVGSTTANRKEWQGVYETVATQARRDMGDSIQKAFQNVPDILKALGMEDTSANQRAVRILGYNSLEITEENISQVKMFDAKVNQTLENMKPATVLELIRRGENPLDMPLEQLNDTLEEINQEKEISSEEKYSRFLWQLEKQNQITQEERSGYIGIYRLLNQIGKTDGAVIGAVMETGQELTLGNLLTQARIRKGNGVDARIGAETGFGETYHSKMSITDQIDLGFAQYQQRVAMQALEEASPTKLAEAAKGNADNLLEMSLEELYDKLVEAQGDEQTDREYYDAEAERLREAAYNEEELGSFLANMHAEETIGNLITLNWLLGEGKSIYKEFYDSRKKLTQEGQEKFEEIVDSFEENMENEESLNAQCAKSEKIMEEVLTKSTEQADISFEDFRNFRQINRGIRLEGVFRSSHSYDIPIRTGDSITSLNLTLIRGAEESGRIQVSMEHDEFGNISMDFKVSDNNVKGLVLCDQRQGFDTLQEQKEGLEERLEQIGYHVKNISYGMDFKSRNEMWNEAEPSQETGTERLYQIAKILVRSVTSAISEK